MIVCPTCPYCGKQPRINLSPEDEAAYHAWEPRRGPFIQDALPNLSADERELLLTGTHPECWNAMFPPDEED